MIRTGIWALVGSMALWGCGEAGSRDAAAATGGAAAGGSGRGGGWEPGEGVPHSTGAPLPPDALGVRLPIPEDPAQAPRAFFENTLFDSTGNLAIWMPPGSDALRGIWFLNGTSNAPNPADIAEGKGWRGEVEQDRQLAARQVASMWSFALITGQTWLEDAHSEDQQFALFQSALGEFASSTSHPEIPELPVAINGGSRFSGFGPMYAARRPGKVIAYVVEVMGVGGLVPENLEVPGLVVAGEEDDGQNKVDSIFAQRELGARVGSAIIWDQGHVCAYCHDLTWPFFDQAVALRLPADSSGPTTLNPLAEESGWLGDNGVWATAYPHAEYPGDATRASWLANAYTADVWRGFTLSDPPVTITEPTRPYSWSNGFSQEPSSLRASAPLDFVVSLNRPFDGRLTLYDGDVPLGELVVAADGATATLSGVSMLPGIHAFVVMSGAAPLSRPAGLVLLD